MDKLVDMLKSRKFWAAVIGLVIVFAGDRAGVDAEALLNAVVVIVGFILGTAVESRVKG